MARAADYRVCHLLYLLIQKEFICTAYYDVLIISITQIWYADNEDLCRLYGTETLIFGATCKGNGASNYHCCDTSVFSNDPVCPIKQHLTHVYMFMYYYGVDLYPLLFNTGSLTTFAQSWKASYSNSRWLLLNQKVHVPKHYLYCLGSE